MKTPEYNGAGCRVNATFKIARVPGNFHISTHSAASQPTNGDMKHVIHELTFGDTIKVCLVDIFIETTKEFFLRVFAKFQIEEHSVR
jgi:hypothetical protein